MDATVDFRQKISSRVTSFGKFFKWCDKETLTKKLKKRNDLITEALEKAFADEGVLSLAEILLESCLRVNSSSSTEQPAIHSLLAHIINNNNQQEKRGEDINIIHDNDHIEKAFGDLMEKIIPYNDKKLEQQQPPHLLEENEQHHFWEIVCNSLYDIVYFEMKEKEEYFCNYMWQQYFFLATNYKTPRTVVELCSNILRFIIASIPNSQLDEHRSAITSVVHNSFLIRYELEGREIFLLESQKATARLIQIVKNLKKGLMTSNSVLWQVLEIILPHNVSSSSSCQKRKKRKTNKFTAWFNSATYSLVGSSDTTFWQKGTITDVIITSIVDDGARRDNRLASYIFRCLALFQVTQDFQYRRQGNEAVIGMWFDQLVANFDGSNKVDTSIPPLIDDELRFTTYTRLCTEKLLAKFVVANCSGNKLLDLLSNWLLSTFDIKFSIPEMGCLILSSILGNVAMLDIVQNYGMLESFIKYPRYSLCDFDSVALSRQFIPFKNSKSPVRKWRHPSDIFEYPQYYEFKDVALVYNNNHPSMYIRIKSKQEAVKWAIAIMMRNCYFVLNKRHRNQHSTTLQDDLLHCYNDVQFIMAVDMVIDVHSGFLCVWIAEEHDVRSLFQLQDVVRLEQLNQPAYHYMGAMCSIFLRMLLEIGGGIPSTMNFYNLFLATDDDRFSNIFFTPPLPKMRDDSTTTTTTDVNNIFTVLVNMLKEYGLIDFGMNKRYEDSDVESVFAVIPFTNDGPIISCGCKFIKSCLEFSSSFSLSLAEFPDIIIIEQQQQQQQKCFQLITKTVDDYLADLRSAVLEK